MNNFKNIKHFNPREKWGDPKKMNPFLLLVMDIIAEEFQKPVIIHCGYSEDGHAEKSQHYKGNACDFHIDTDEPFKDVYNKLINILVNTELGDNELDDLVGLGVYPHWNNKGFHLDVRGCRARWMRDKNNNYVAINTKEL